jgi:hypothetical protein
MSVVTVGRICGAGTFDSAAVAITGGTGLWDDGTQAVPSIAFASQSGTGWSYASSSIREHINGTYISFRDATRLRLKSTQQIQWSSGDPVAAGGDVILGRDALGIMSLWGSSSAVLASMRKYGGNAGYVEWGSVSENLTLSTGGTTTDTAANLLPADSYIESVTGRVTTTVATATDWKLGDATTAGRFTAAQSGAQLTAGATIAGLVHCDVTGNGGPRQTAAAKVRVTTTGTPSAGAIRITSYYRTFVAPTS